MRASGRSTGAADRDIVQVGLTSRTTLCPGSHSDRWRICVVHANPIPAARPAESLAEQFLVAPLLFSVTIYW